MASKISAPRTQTTPKVSKPAPPPKPRPAKAAPVPKDTVAIRGEKAGGNANLSALQKGLASNFDVSGSEPVKDPAPVGASASAKEAVKAENPTPDSTPGQRSVDLARSFEGELSQDVKGKLDNFQAAGGNSNNCADFVSSVLETSGRGIEQTPRVNELREQLLEKGWTEISAEDARPGDVWMTESDTYGSRHTELVSQADGEGGFHTIGSNNISSDQQRITEREKSGGVIYGQREPEATE